MLTSAYREKEALMMDPSRLFIGLLALLSLATVVDAQNESCACSPGTYRFTLDFGSNCTEVEPTGGIVSLLCDYIALGDIENVTDFVPVTVENILIIELGNDSIGIAQQNFSQAFNNGDSFEYVSSINDDASTIPKTIQLNILGQNAAGQSIINFLAIQFTNNCSFYPVLDEGSSLGWTVITELGNPPEGVCTAFDSIAPPSSAPVNESASPSASPSESPSSAPINPSLLPTTGPMSVSSLPTTAPVITSSQPTMAPVDGTSPPTMAPVAVSAAPTIAPVVVSTAPTIAPVVVSAAPTIAPVVVSAAPTISPVVVSAAPTIAPVDVSPAPTIAPVDVSPAPTMAPIVVSPTQTMAPVVDTPPPTTTPSVSPTGAMSMDLSDTDMIDDMMDDLADYGIQVPKAKDVVKSKKSKQGKRGKKGSDTKLTRGSKKQTKKSSTYGGGDAKEADKISIEGESTVTMSENSSKKERSNASEPKLSKADSKKDSKTRRRLRIPQGIK